TAAATAQQCGRETLECQSWPWLRASLHCRARLMSTFSYAGRMVGERPLPVEGGLPVPLPLVTDLDGDGKNEVVVLADGGM
ncbi:unnamed protein product, partial [Ectocarpus sp. 8 AP-2014]